MRPILLLMWTAFQSFILRHNNNEIETPKEYKEKMKRKRTEDRSGKQLHGQFKRETDDLSGVSWEWIKLVN